MGIVKALEVAGIEEGDQVRIGKNEFLKIHLEFCVPRFLLFKLNLVENHLSFFVICLLVLIFGELKGISRSKKWLRYTSIAPKCCLVRCFFIIS